MAPASINHRDAEGPLQTYWCLVGPSGRTLTAALYRSEHGLELRCDYTLSDVVFRQPVTDAGAAAAQATGWRTAFLASGGFSEVTVPR
jgi:hypothetical protein